MIILSCPDIVVAEKRDITQCYCAMFSYRDMFCDLLLFDMLQCIVVMCYSAMCNVYLVAMQRITMRHVMSLNKAIC